MVRNGLDFRLVRKFRSLCNQKTFTYAYNRIKLFSIIKVTFIFVAISNGTTVIKQGTGCRAVLRLIHIAEVS